MKKNYTLFPSIFIACFLFSLQVGSQIITGNRGITAMAKTPAGGSPSTLWTADSSTMSGNLKTFQ
ncbi:MAG TPA: hypothetical protein VNZ45_11575, partial [Bacteroidia bacterium]|nr:hypothetical protein [Bacteroidia bacterium]